ncbi:DNA cytosine methyltransferase [Paenibacillus sinopodophylli]|uniref:DNA cytosine methyltransferase n=1 Tax=Paenibacillus sinopodophylli TaxID=1837342 RepID=UPI00110D0BCE|nr:DNA (cytosine-5-)-methyltransferase [Paenibacillus sinopodophylli]
MPLLVNDFFCGTGGMGLGFIRAGYTVAKAWDFDTHAVKSYRENVDHSAEQADITHLTWKDVPKAHVWTFGFPCQDLSVAGHGEGIKVKCTSCAHEFIMSAETESCPECNNGKFRAANRSGMLFEIMRLLEEIRENDPDKLPEVILAENVKKLRPLIPVLGNAFAIQGYVMQEPNLYNSKYWGVAQSRERYYVAGIRKDLPQEGFAYPVEDTQRPIPKLADFLDTDAPEKYYVSDEKARKVIDDALKRLETLGSTHAAITPDRMERRQNGPRAKADNDPMFTLTAQDLHGVIVDTRNTRNGRGVYSETTVPALLSTDYKEPKSVIEQQPGISVVGILDNQGTTQEHNNRVHDPEGISPTLTAVSGGTHHIKIFDYSRYRVRRLTPTEYGRLQGFPMDTWNQVVSDSQAYKQFGNAVTVGLAEAQAIAITDYLKNFTPAVICK